MAPAVPLISAVAGYATTTALGGGLLASLGGFVVSTAVNQIGSRLFGKKPKTSSFGADASGRVVQVRSSVESHKVVYGQARVSGPLVYVSTTNDGFGPASPPRDNKFLHMVIALAGHEVEEIGDVYFNDQVVSFIEGTNEGYVVSSPYYPGASYAYVQKMTGSPDQAANAVMLVDAPNWTAEHRLRGIAYLYVRLEYSGDIFPLGIPNISAVVKGKKVYDPRTGLTQWSDNAALCIRDYLTSEYGFGCSADEINDPHFIAAANTCDEAVPLSSGGPQPRFTCDGVVDTAAAPLENLNQLVSAVAGAVTYVQGKFRLHAGVYESPVGDIGIDALAGGVTLQARTPRKELFNAVKGTYVAPNRSWQPTDFPPVTNALYEAQDNDERIYKDVELPFTTHPEAAQRIAKILLEKARQGLVVEMTVNHSCLQYAVFDVVTLTNEQLGWSAKPFRILKWAMQNAGAITLTLQEESSASYDWNSGEATAADTAPDTNLPDPLFVSPPGTPVVTEELYVTTDGSGVKSKAVVTWAASADAFARDYQLEYKLTADTSQTVVGRTFATSLEVLDVAPGAYDFRVKVYNNLGVSSAYASTTAEMYGLTAAPSAISTLSLNPIHDNAHLSWAQVSDIDVRVGGYIRIRYTPEIASPTWSTAIDIGPALPGIATHAVLPLLTGTYLAKAVDSTGNESPTAAVVKSTIANIVRMNRVVTLTQDPQFIGGITGGTVVLDGALQLRGQTLFDSVAGNFDDAPGNFDGGVGGGFRTTATYPLRVAGGGGWLDAADLGRVTTARVSLAMVAQVYDPSAVFDSALGNFDDRMGLFDGDDITGITFRFEMWTSDDAVTTKDVVRNVIVGDYTARYFLFYLHIDSQDTSLNVRVTELAAILDVPDITDRGSFETSAAGVTAVPFAKDFYSVPDVGVTIQAADVGDQEILQAITNTGFEVGVKDAGGAFVARTISWAANGY